MLYRLLLLSLSAFTVNASAEPVVHSALVTGSIVIAFAPPETRGQTDDGSIEGVAHVRFALQDTKQCLGSMRVQFAFEFADVVELQSGDNSETIQVAALGQGFGAVLVEPGRKARVVVATDGPSTLLYLLPQAVAEYWNVEACKVDG